MLIGLVGSRVDKIKIETALMDIDSRRNRHGFLKINQADVDELPVNSDFWKNLVRSKKLIAVIGVYDPADARLVREYGVIWHLMGRVSGTVKIEPMDIMVAAGTEPVGHILGFESAWSETLRRVLHGQRSKA